MYGLRNLQKTIRLFGLCYKILYKYSTYKCSEITSENRRPTSILLTQVIEKRTEWSRKQKRIWDDRYLEAFHPSTCRLQKVTSKDEKRKKWEIYVRRASQYRQSPDVVMVIKLKVMRWMRHIQHLMEHIYFLMVYKVLSPFR